MHRFLCIAIFVALIASASNADNAKAQVMPPFGGLTTFAEPCEVPPAWLIYDIPVGGGPVSLMFIYGGTINYSFFIPFLEGVYILGSYIPVSIPCYIYVGVTLVQIGQGDFIYQVGSSL